MQTKLHAWQQRRMASIRSELGFFDKTLFAPHLALELSEGCSMQCWYCGFAAGKLSGKLDFSAGRQLFCGVLEQALQILGPDEASTTLLFHATEPYDNPDYIAFMTAFERIAGCKPFTSTAAGHDLDWIAALLRYYDNTPRENLRINCFTPIALQRIRESFPADALAGVEMNVIDRATAYPIKQTGRLLGKEPDLRDTYAYCLPEATSTDRPPPSTIACLVGFKVNLISRTIELIAPCQATEDWPLGYRMYDHDCFSDDHDFLTAIDRIIDRAMPLSIPLDRIIRFRDDLQYETAPGGFILASPGQVHSFSAHHDMVDLSALIAHGTYTRHEIQNVLAVQFQAPALKSALAIHNLFQNGFLDEVSRDFNDQNPGLEAPATAPVPEASSFG